MNEKNFVNQMDVIKEPTVYLYKDNYLLHEKKEPSGESGCKKRKLPVREAEIIYMQVWGRLYKLPVT